MSVDLMVSLSSGKAAARAARPSAWPAILDVLQSVSGLLLVLFLGAHAFFVASILISEEAMYTVTRAFEGYYLFGAAYPLLVSIAAAGVLALFILHAALAMRKFPVNYRQYSIFKAHKRRLDHTDTRLWMIQVHTGFALFFLGSAHLAVMLVHPEQIGPYASADRVWGGSWIIDLPLLIVVQAHAGIGLYRLAVKWNWFQTPGKSGISRTTLRRVIFGATGGFLLLGLVSIGQYMLLGYEHRDQVGERYQPAVTGSISKNEFKP
jgi:fumarate reductase subunit C